MALDDVLPTLGIALALGLLVGLQRERAASRVAGIRTFALITVFGALAGLSQATLGPWLIAAGALALAALLVIANVAKLHTDPSPGLTTELAAMVMYAVGVYLVIGHAAAAIAVTGAVVLLLHFKQPMHGIVRAMGERDVAAVMQFALVTLVILPVLPDRPYGPYGVLNPRQIWTMVVLIVTINLAGYVAYKRLSAQAGALLGGVVGGLISSTATTVSFARRTRTASVNENGNSTEAALAAVVIVVASTVSVARVIIEVAVVAPSQLHTIGVPLAAMLAWMLAISAVAWLRGRADTAAKLPPAGNPAELKPALIFCALYAVVILAVAWAKDRYGNAGLYPVAVLSGLTDVDAITLSTSRLAQQGQLEAATTWRIVLLAVLSNLVFKGGSAWALGSPGLRAHVAVYFGLALAGGAAILLWWPVAAV